jgi:MoaA/NifB/PqqE/SkfB family radical SAM enzyme
VNAPSERPTENSGFVRKRTADDVPRIPLEASIDLTYRCNNSCRHCWLWLPKDSPERANELSLEEWREIIDQARALGTRRWTISGGEPMLRPDFADIFEYATARSAGYSLNTNGTLITPAIARMLRRRGNKMVAVYGATPDVYDRVTRSPGAFEQLTQGLAYLREAGAGFVVQLIPMRDNWHQWDQMVEFALSWSKVYRVGAPWLWMSACGGAERNAEIVRQRLDPADVVMLDPPASPPSEHEHKQHEAHVATAGKTADPGDDRLYAECIHARRDYHFDPYGTVSFCSYVKDASLRYDLRRGSAGGVPRDAVRTAWEDFIPLLADSIRGGTEYRQGCAVCELRADCRWCGVFGYLEHGHHGAKVDFLCAVALETRCFKRS